MVVQRLQAEDRVIEGHEGHALRRGPMTWPRETHWVCLDCEEIGVAHGRTPDIPPWAEQDYWDHLDWIEGDRADEIRRMRNAD